MRIALLFTLGIAALMLIGAGAPRDGATIVNSGSTNTAGYTVAVWSDGEASLSIRGGTTRTFAIPSEESAREANAPAQFCMKSASFGTRTVVTWHGWTSPDLQCPPQEASTAALAQDVRRIVAASGLAGPPHRIGLPPSLRKIPQTTPEVTPT